ALDPFVRETCRPPFSMRLRFCASASCSRRAGTRRAGAEAYSPPIASLRNDGAGGPAVGLYSRRRLPRKGSAAVAARALAHSVSHELALLDATAQAELVRQRKASPRELVDAAIARIERVNPKLNAVIIQRFEKARAEAAAPDLPDGPFRGVPFLLKDLICHSAGDPYHAGMRLLRELGWVERYDTHLAARFRAAGFVFLGRTNV